MEKVLKIGTQVVLTVCGILKILNLQAPMPITDYNK